MALKPGDLLGPYALQERLGSGGFGSVWRATRVGSLVPIPVAVKIGHELQSDADGGADAVERLLAEARTWVSASGHRNVVPVQDAGVWDGHLILVSELMTEGSLRSRIGRLGGQPMPTREAVGLALGILAGLEHLHRLNIVHRDLKPENILLQHGDPRITDFGISRFATRSAKTRHYSGTLQYLSPDAFENRVSFQMDIWAVGVILYELLTGHLPFNGGSDAQVMHAILTGPVPPMGPGVHPTLRRVVMTALERDLPSRYATAAAFRQELDTAWRSVRQDVGEVAATVPSSPTDPESVGVTRIRQPIETQDKPAIESHTTADKPTFRLEPVGTDVPPAPPRKNPELSAAPSGSVRPHRALSWVPIAGVAGVLIIGVGAFGGLFNSKGPSPATAGSAGPSTPAPPVIETKLLTPARRGAAYRMTLAGKAANPVWSWDTSAAPPGLSLSPGGEITGTPTRTGDYQLSIRLTTNAGGAAAVQPMPLRVLPPESVEKKVNEAAGLLKSYETEASRPNATSRMAELSRMANRADSLLRDAIRTDPDYSEAWYQRVLARYIIQGASGDWKSVSTQALRKFTEPRFTDQRMELSK